jgi:hypothetical protein
MAVAISDIGKEVRSILYGAKDGVFQYDQKLSYSTRTADGVQLVLNAIRKDEKADLSLRTVYNYGNYGLNATFTTSDKVHVLASVDKIAPGVKVSLSATLPDKESGKLLVDYINQVSTQEQAAVTGDTVDPAAGQLLGAVLASRHNRTVSCLLLLRVASNCC